MLDVMDVLALLEVVGRCLAGIEDVLANPSDVVVGDSFSLDVAFEDTLAEGPDDVDVQFVDVHCLPDADL